MLVHAWVTDTATLMSTDGVGKVPERGFVLGTPKRIYHFLASSAEEKNSWFQELQTKIFAQKRLFNEVIECALCLHACKHIGYTYKQSVSYNPCLIIQCETEVYVQPCNDLGMKFTTL